MNKSSRLALAVCAAISLAACKPSPPLTADQVKSVKGMTMDQVKAKLGGPYVVTNAGDSIWWDYNDIQGNASGTCQVVFTKGVAEKVKC